jgi:hypothetical protein
MKKQTKKIIKMLPNSKLPMSKQIKAITIVAEWLQKEQNLEIERLTQEENKKSKPS